ncbi:tRNA lysidine(34) synthetase TilS [Hoyosella rhizosphaerae]|uniref:tRNA(Ile)-lysidine synthase n=1 Tax=Hoyosella rhizosphaerae TaxID=1755582 RepID=A0A916XIQ0_9ACTN|nr:tRNA lysidine(34) synthetase TilS [Hoyosella rhizosphaerae]MBN4925326.1 tRNA lysidine(34) synthetase TilS [Hoyosella rhizosphaerae]GGC76192.1 tRNA(Ile)-lysidine synthase [Hoyosella rhizosphaerae]
MTRRIQHQPAFIQVRGAVRAWFAEHRPIEAICVAISGGADSMALCAATVAESPVPVHAITVDHRLQRGSDIVARAAAESARALGCSTATILPVQVSNRGGMEAAARTARYEALGTARRGNPVLLGHTLDDQAETVLLGLARGSGTRSLSGMRAFSPPWGRPLLTVRRATTGTACAELGITPFDDPHNSDPRFTRVRVRNEALPLLESILGGGVVEALGRTATQLQDDGDVLDSLASDVLAGALIGNDLSVEPLIQLAPSIRRRVLRAWLLLRGTGAVTSIHLGMIDALVSRWKGQGPVAVPSADPSQLQGARLVVQRRHGTLTLGVQQHSGAQHSECDERGT